MENRHGLVVNATVTPATAEREVALTLVEAQAPTRQGTTHSFMERSAHRLWSGNVMVESSGFL